MVQSQKGGVGKTLTVANFAARLADLDLSVLMADFDPQADLSHSWGLDEQEARPRIEDVLDGRVPDPREAIEHIPLGEGSGGLGLLPTACERLRRETGRLLTGDGQQLAHVLAPVGANFDVALIDTPAGDTVFGRQALVAADTAIVPMLPGYHELRAMTCSLDLLDGWARDAHTRLDLLGVLLLNADGRWRSTKEYRQHLSSADDGDAVPLFETVIPRHQPITDHARYGLPTVWLRPQTTVAKAYGRLALEVVTRLREQHGLETAIAHASCTAAGGS
ncbi:ParA family protein [Solirubrobacter soli]|uniref:ParA family protein n=1 Tax=Solirubrobacter soli TaxID=363832 RepID=UPI000488BC66|nr:ParA family protein [Solirubrobacter soli]